MPNVFIVGDSFAAHDPRGWTCQLGQEFAITNLASNGSSQYRLLKTVIDTDLDPFDSVVVVHTSPNRIYIEQNPYYKNSGTHANCDLIYEDIRSRLPDKFATHVTWWFENVFDLKQAHDMHELLCERIIQLVSHKPAIHMSFFEIGHIPGIEILHETWQQNTGKTNHMNETGNQLVAEFVKNQLKLH